MTIIYFAWIRERLGTSEETISLPETVSTVADLLDHLASRGAPYDDVLSERVFIKTAVNQQHVTHDHAIKDGDEIALFPPVTGG